MPITAVTPAAAAGGINAAAPTRAPKQSMDGEMFMQLMIIQLKNQDPSAPMDTNAMMAQTNQLAQMEKLTEMAGTSSQDFSLQMRSAAAALIGKSVTYTGPDGAEVTGTATSVSYSGSVPQVTVNGRTVALDAVAGVAA
ncbi:flagellar hook capping FlgD N-terminal domain-containing protein [Pseudarthrobacter sp. BIM B-2242]|uniref:flagellar hook capping FlgD N-terminal domain-containing protein n=1 Tax=Pseudarthrobacter sp. BIM B-2242 TaxID=2772401 RepID=UPI00168ABD47|nr:flagellar hook capping FlgD N-terminal domain-containing protein [Pseudarthrobacter sp. BIM B-2242]QOD05756.1 flagellar hook capping protein [Pseudarthrobacter sp. BIM B-2242]